MDTVHFSCRRGVYHLSLEELVEAVIFVVVLNNVHFFVYSEPVELAKLVVSDTGYSHLEHYINQVRNVSVFVFVFQLLHDVNSVVAASDSLILLLANLWISTKIFSWIVNLYMFE